MAERERPSEDEEIVEGETTVESQSEEESLPELELRQISRSPEAINEVEGRKESVEVFETLGHRVEEHWLVVGFAGSDGRRRHHPDGDAFLPARVDIARHLQRLLGVHRVQAAAVLVLQALLAADEHFPQRPVVLMHGGFLPVQAACWLAAARSACLRA